MTNDTSQRRLRRIGLWFDRHYSGLGYATLGLLVGLMAGWWAGGYLACSRSLAGCEVRADSLGAAGTWFGAIGTVAAVLAAVAAFRSEERIRRQEAHNAAQRRSAIAERYRAEASMVTIHCHANHEAAGRVVGYALTVHNGTDGTSLYQLQGREPNGQLLGARELTAGESSVTHRGPGEWRASQGLAKRELELYLVERTEITFRMNEKTWRRVGDGDVVTVEHDDELTRPLG